MSAEGLFVAGLSADRPLFFPDVEELLAAFLRARGGFDGVSVGPVLPPDFDGTGRAVVLTRLGGRYRQDDGVDEALVRVDSYGPGKPASQELASAVRGVLPLLTTVAHAGGVVVSDVDEHQGPCWSPDRRHGDADRYLMKYRLIIAIHPIPA
jgi:hypothetical protein